MGRLSVHGDSLAGRQMKRGGRRRCRRRNDHFVRHSNAPPDYSRWKQLKTVLIESLRKSQVNVSSSRGNISDKEGVGRRIIQRES